MKKKQLFLLAVLSTTFLHQEPAHASKIGKALTTVGILATGGCAAAIALRAHALKNSPSEQLQGNPYAQAAFELVDMATNDIQQLMNATKKGALKLFEQPTASDKAKKDSK